MRNILIAGLLSGLFLTPSLAQTTLTIEECRQKALEHNKEIAAARYQTLYADYTRKSYFGNFFPNIKATGIGLNTDMSANLGVPAFMLPVGTMDATGAFTPNGTYAGFPGMDIGFKVGTVYGGAVILEQPIFMGGKIIAAYKSAKEGLNMARQSEALTKSEIILNTESAYALLIKAQEMEKVAQSYHDLLLELEKTVESAVRNGMKQKNDLLKVQVHVGSSELALMKAQNAVKLAAMNLCHMIGYSLGSEIRATGDYPLVQQQALNRSDISSRPEFAILQSQVEMARQNVNLQRSELLPTLGVMGAYGYANGIKVNGNKLIDRSSYAVMLKLSIPIYHFGERTNKVRAAKAQLRQKELEQESLQEQMLLELTQEANRLDEAFKEAEISAKALESAQENIKVSQKHYENGMETLTGLLEAQTLWQQAYEKDVEAHFNLYTQYVTYLKASGQLN